MQAEEVLINRKVRETGSQSTARDSRSKDKCAILVPLQRQLIPVNNFLIAACRRFDFVSQCLTDICNSHRSSPWFHLRGRISTAFTCRQNCTRRPQNAVGSALDSQRTTAWLSRITTQWHPVLAVCQRSSVIASSWVRSVIRPEFRSRFAVLQEDPSLAQWRCSYC